MADDPLFNFLQSVTEKIKVEKEHKALMERIDDNVVVPTEDPLLSAINVLKQKIIEVKQPEMLEATENKTENTESASEAMPEAIEEKDNFGDFLSKLKDIISGDKLKDASPAVVTTETPTPVVQEQENTEPKIVESKPDIVDIKNDYVDVLDKLSNEVAVEKEPQKISEIKKLIEQYAEKYFKKAAVMSEYAGGGGTNAVQYANGGTMNGDLNVTGNYLSAGVNLLNILSGGGGGGGDPAVNALVHSNSGNWNSTYTTVQSYSGAWSTGIQNLAFDESNYNLSITNGNTVGLSAIKQNFANFVHLSGDTMTGALSTPALSTSNIVATENVGIGIAAPLRKFHQQGGKLLVNSDSGSWGQLQITNPGVGETSMVFANDATINSNGSLTSSQADYIWNIGLGSYANDANKFIIGNNGYEAVLTVVENRVGIGTTDPATKLHVAGYSDDVNTPIQIIESTGSQAPYTFRVSNTDQAYVKGDDAGNLAFGAQNFIALETGGFGGAHEAVRVLATGEVGIGTATPATQLDVNGEVTASGGNSTQWNTAYNNAIYNVYGTANQIVVATGGTNNADNNVTLSFASSAYFPGDVSVQGNLYLTGSATYINAQNLIVGDNLIYLNANNTGNLLDTGFVSHFTQGPLGYQHTGLVRKSGQGNPGIWTLFSGLTTEPLTASNIDWSDKNLTLDALSANIYAAGGNSDQWSSNYNTTNANSGRWSSAYSSFNANSGKYDSVWTIVNTNSATTWNYQGTDIKALTGRWDSNYTTTSSNSANWSQAYTNLVSNSAAYLSAVDISLLATTSGSWNSNYTTTNINSAFWSNAYTNLVGNSANYLSGISISTVQAYLSTNNVLLSSCTITGNLSVLGTIYSTASAYVTKTLATTIGDGVNTSYTITHNFGTTNVQVAVYDTVTNVQSFPTVTITNGNTVTLNFAAAPGAGAYRVVILGAVPSNNVVAYGPTVGTLASLAFAASDELANITTGNAKITFTIPQGFTLTKIKGGLNTAATGSSLIFSLSSQTNNNTAGTVTMPANALVADASVNYACLENDRMCINVSQVGSTTPGTGLKVYLIGRYI